MALKNLTSPALTPVEQAKKRLRKYMRNHSDGISTDQVRSWVDSVRVPSPIVFQEFQQALREMVESGEAACTNDRWWLRRRDKGPPPLLPRESDERPDNGPLFSGFLGQNKK